MTTTFDFSPPVMRRAFTDPSDRVMAMAKLSHRHHTEEEEEDSDGLTTDDEMPEMGWHSDSASELECEFSSANTSPAQTPQDKAATSPLVPPPIPCMLNSQTQPADLIVALTPVQLLEKCGLPATPENLYKLQVQANQLLVDKHDWKKQHLPWMHKPAAFYDEALDRLKVEPEKRNQWCLQSRYGHQQALQYTLYQHHMLAAHQQTQQSIRQAQQPNQNQRQTPPTPTQQPRSPPMSPSFPPTHKQLQPPPMALSPPVTLAPAKISESLSCDVLRGLDAIETGDR